MIHRVCKMFEVESGHMLSKHPDRCRFPHGHSRQIEVILEADSLDENDMVVDFAAVKCALKDFLDRFDHAMAVNSADPALPGLQERGDRIVVFENEDPTTEVLARSIFEYLEGELAAGRSYTAPNGHAYSLRNGVRVSRIRVGETSSSWAECARG